MKIGSDGRILNVALWGLQYIGAIGGHVSVLSQRCRRLTVFVHIGAMGVVFCKTTALRCWGLTLAKQRNVHRSASLVHQQHHTTRNPVPVPSVPHCKGRLPHNAHQTGASCRKARRLTDPSPSIGHQFIEPKGPELSGLYLVTS